jgi:hypothetical protein
MHITIKRTLKNPSMSIIIATKRPATAPFTPPRWDL